MTEKECYEVLGISKKSTDMELKQAYKQLAKIYHPDMRLGDNSAKKKFLEVQEAYETIIDIRAKRKQRIEKIIKTFVPTSEKEVQNTVDTPHRGRDIYSILEISFEESILGCKKQIHISKNVFCDCTKDNRSNCPKCQGKGIYRKAQIIEIQVPKGVFNGQTLKIRGKGNSSTDCGENGDLLINVHIQPNDVFFRKGIDIYTKLIITYPEAVLGTNKIIPTVYGNVECVIPPGIQNNAKLELRGKGIIKEKDNVEGNEYVIVNIEIPKHITEKQKNIIMELQHLFNENK